MNLSDDRVRALILSTGFKPGDPVTDDVARAWMNAGNRSGLLTAMKLIRDLSARCKPTYPFGQDPMNNPQHMAKTAAENCLRVIEHYVNTAGEAPEMPDGGDEG